MAPKLCNYLVVTAALMPAGGRLFLAQRPPWKKFGLRWEFPGGKVEPGEDLKESLVREIKEELSLDITVCDLFRKVSHSEEDFAIHLHAFWCIIRGGEFRLGEHVAFTWAEPSELRRIDMTGADRLLIPFLEEMGKLPDLPGMRVPRIARESPAR